MQTHEEVVVSNEGKNRHEVVHNWDKVIKPKNVLLAIQGFEI